MVSKLIVLNSKLVRPDNIFERNLVFEDKRVFTL